MVRFLQSNDSERFLYQILLWGLTLLIVAVRIYSIRVSRVELSGLPD